ncbi:YceI family protein [Flavobacterium sp.]|uniref:YceI family protein n=1 Tax=Flavobacterium sp. TaxID=239 RepID=UPI002611BF5C|nr:YceI family protein [Flavobacterium sp.]
MKKTLFMLLAICFIGSVSAQVRKINVKNSTITWVGKKITGEHQGSLKFKEGSLTFKSKTLTNGSFTVDMTTLTNTDQTGKGKEKLEGHLKSSDFFATDEFKTAKMVFKTIKLKSKGTYGIAADLTIKGKTNPVTFDLITKGKTATANLIIDRTKFGIQYGSGSFFDDLGDRTIYDEFELQVKLSY